MLPEHAALAEFGAEIGLAFQIQDDILDVEGNTTTLGKRAGADADRVKPTYPSVLGLEKARAQALARRDRAIAALAPWGARFAPLANSRISSWRAPAEVRLPSPPCPACKLRPQCPTPRKHFPLLRSVEFARRPARAARKPARRDLRRAARVPDPQRRHARRSFRRRTRHRRAHRGAALRLRHAATTGWCGTSATRPIRTRC